MSTNKWFNVVLFLGGFVIAFIGMGIDSFFIKFIGFFTIIYGQGLNIAQIDRELMIAKEIELSSIEKKILFPFQPNLFYRNTVIAQRVWTYYFTIGFIIYTFKRDQMFIIIALLIQIIIYIILYFFLDFTTRKSFSLNLNFRS